MDNINAIIAIISIIIGTSYTIALDIFYSVPNYFSIAMGSIIACLSLIYLTKEV